ncbi:MAG: hypothetical protein KTR23_13015 [Rhodospirillales bacterium]|nr:hypothetical protein [Rhodospirillales bacterium]
MAGGDYPVPDWPGRIAGDEGHDRIAACLVLDIQRAQQWGKQVLSHVENVQDGGESHWEMGMNAYMLHVRRETTDISPVYEETGDPAITVQTADLRKALVAWCQQIAKETD